MSSVPPLKRVSSPEAPDNNLFDNKHNGFMSTPPSFRPPAIIPHVLPPKPQVWASTTPPLPANPPPSIVVPTLQIDDNDSRMEPLRSIGLTVEQIRSLKNRTLPTPKITRSLVMSSPQNGRDAKKDRKKICWDYITGSRSIRLNKLTSAPAKFSDELLLPNRSQTEPMSRSWSMNEQQAELLDITRSQTVPQDENEEKKERSLYRRGTRSSWSEDRIYETTADMKNGLKDVMRQVYKGPFYPSQYPDIRPLKWEEKFFSAGAEPPARYGHTAHLLGTDLVVCGGHTTGEPFHILHLDSSEEVETSFISSKTPYSTLSRVGHASTLVGDAVYMFGGWNDEARKYLGSGLLVQLPIEGTSLRVSQETCCGRTMPKARRDCTIVWASYKLILFGGWNQDEFFNDTWTFSTSPSERPASSRTKSETVLFSSKEWKRQVVRGNRPTRRRGHGAAVVTSSRNAISRMYVFGGMYGRHRYFNDFFVLNIKSWEWKKVKDMGFANQVPPHNRAWHSMESVPHREQIVVFGGTCGKNQFFNDLWVFDTCAERWFFVDIKESPVPPPRASHSLCVRPVYDGFELIVYAGFGPEEETPPQLSYEDSSSYHQKESLLLGTHHSNLGDNESEDRNAMLSDCSNDHNPRTTDHLKIVEASSFRTTKLTTFSDLWVLRTVLPNADEKIENKMERDDGLTINVGGKSNDEHETDEVVLDMGCSKQPLRNILE